MRFEAYEIEREGCLSEEFLHVDYSEAPKFGKLRLSNQMLYWSGLTKISYLPLADILWAYPREENVPAKACCGQVIFANFSLVVHTRLKRRRQLEMDYKEDLDALLKELAAVAPYIVIGYSQERLALYGAALE